MILCFVLFWEKKEIEVSIRGSGERWGCVLLCIIFTGRAWEVIM